MLRAAVKAGNWRLRTVGDLHVPKVYFVDDEFCYDKLLNKWVLLNNILNHTSSQGCSNIWLYVLCSLFSLLVTCAVKLSELNDLNQFRETISAITDTTFTTWLVCVRAFIRCNCFCNFFFHIWQDCIASF